MKTLRTVNVLALGSGTAQELIASPATKEDLQDALETGSYDDRNGQEVLL